MSATAGLTVPHSINPIFQYIFDCLGKRSISKILVRWHHWTIFLQKWARRCRYVQWRALPCHAQRIFVSKNWRGWHGRDLVSTGRGHFPHSQRNNRSLAHRFRKSNNNRLRSNSSTKPVHILVLAWYRYSVPRQYQWTTSSQVTFRSRAGGRPCLCQYRASTANISALLARYQAGCKFPLKNLRCMENFWDKLNKMIKKPNLFTFLTIYNIFSVASSAFVQVPPEKYSLLLFQLCGKVWFPHTKILVKLTQYMKEKSYSLRNLLACVIVKWLVQCGRLNSHSFCQTCKCC